MQEILYVGAGGFLGACARFGITRWLSALPVALPCGTLLSNGIAGLLIGLVIGVESQTAPISSGAKLFFITGVLGGLSTFSTFSLETVHLFKAGRYLLATGNIALNLGLSLGGVLVGMALGRSLAKLLGMA
ncbi:MAG: CrcB family protein [Clostridia bacterium]|nr:CrcB family protein [Candidatus Pelethousia sp.]NCB29888.1 CrcB family protein [Clostridia bacterium]